MSEMALRLPGPGSVLASQIRYQLTLLGRNPRAIVAGLVLPGALLALERGNAQHITMTQAAPKIAGLVAFSAIAIAFFTHALGLVTAREEGVLRRWHASPLPAWAHFAGRILATMAVTAGAGLILVLVAVGMTGVHLTAQAVVGLPHWVNTAMTYLPVQPVIDAASRSLQGSGAIMSAHDLAALAAWVVSGLLVSCRFFAWDPHRPAHAGKAEARTTARSA